MSIPFWRYVEYTDGGCAIFQCLSCYEDWEARTPPGYTHDGYTAIWHYCPACGVKWEGCRRERADEYGPRRQRAYEAVERRRWVEPLPPGCVRPYETPEPPFWWVLEERYHSLVIGTYDPSRRWDRHCKMRGLAITAKRALEILRATKANRDRDYGEDKDSVMEYRLVKVRDLGTHNYIYEVHR